MSRLQGETSRHQGDTTPLMRYAMPIMRYIMPYPHIVGGIRDIIYIWGETAFIRGDVTCLHSAPIPQNTTSGYLLSKLPPSVPDIAFHPPQAEKTITGLIGIIPVIVFPFSGLVISASRRVRRMSVQSARRPQHTGLFRRGNTRTPRRARSMRDGGSIFRQSALRSP